MKTTKCRGKKRTGEDGSVGRYQTHLLPWTQHNKSTTTCGIIPLERDLKTVWTEPPQQRVKGQAETGRRGRDMVSTRKNPHPSHNKPQWGGVTKVRIFSLRYEGFSSTLGTPTLRSCTGEMSPQNICLWKPMRNVPRKTTELQRTENLLLKGWCADPPD